jgi:hypothetical protein
MHELGRLGCLSGDSFLTYMELGDEDRAFDRLREGIEQAHAAAELQDEIESERHRRDYSYAGIAHRLGGMHDWLADGQSWKFVEDYGEVRVECHKATLAAWEANP